VYFINFTLLVPFAVFHLPLGRTLRRRFWISNLGGADPGGLGRPPGEHVVEGNDYIIASALRVKSFLRIHFFWKEPQLISSVIIKLSAQKPPHANFLKRGIPPEKWQTR
jgi:hypothetical protein